MAELLFIKLDPQNVEKLFHHLLTTELCTLGVQHCFTILFLSYSHSKCLSMHISLSNE